MKTKLLKLALCAIAALPIGAWADDIDFGSEASVSKTTLWTFDDLTTGDGYYTSRTTGDTGEFPKLGNAYLRSVVTGRSFVVSDVTGPTSITLIDGTTKNITKYLHVNAAAADLAKLKPTGTANTYTETHKATGVFAFNAEVAGSIYVYAKGATTSKTLRIYHSDKVGSGGDLSGVTFSITSADDMMILSYTSSKKGTFFIGGAETLCDIYAVQFVPSDIAVSAATSFKITAVPFESMTGICNVPNGLVYRASSGRSMSIQDASKTITFSDEASIDITKKLVTTNSIDGPTESTPNASSVGGSRATPMLAFKTTNKGTVYVKMAATAESVNGRIYWGNGSGAPTNKVNTSLTKDAETELSWTSDEAGSFFIGATGACEIYAVRFVPSEIKTTIGSHGKSSFSCAQGLDFSSATPAGLKAYKAKEVNGDGLVVLSSVDEAPAGTGLILSGEPGTEYTIPVKDDAAVVGTNLMVGTITETAVAASTSSVHNYIWAYTASGLGFYNVATGTTSAAGKAYLSTGATALNTTTPARGFIFEDEDVTGIDVVKGSELKANGEYFNLNGQRVAQPTKGLYIVNGKKVIIK